MCGGGGSSSSGGSGGGHHKGKPKRVGGFTVGTAQDGQPTLDGIRVPTVTELYRMDPYAPDRSYSQQLQDWAHGKCDNSTDVPGVTAFCKDAHAAGLLGDDSGIKLTWADLDPIGVIDTYNCVRHGKSCGSAAVDVGMDLLFQSESKDAAKIAERAAAKAAEDVAEGDGAKALEEFLKCASNSFPGDTPVLLASGTTEPIDDLAVGDTVLATDPLTGTTAPHQVTRVIKTLTDTDFTDLTISTPAGPTVLTSTRHHPYWDVTRNRWADAADIRPGDRLRTADGRTAQVTGVRDYTGHIVTYNLTVDVLHTYYVVAGGTPVLVHNNSCGNPVRIRAGQQAAGGSYKLSKAELKFVGDLMARKPNLQVFRTDGKASMGDFLVIDRSDPRSAVGWVVELKTSHGGFPGEQFRNAGSLRSLYGLSQLRTVAGTPSEVLESLSVGRGSWN